MHVCAVDVQVTCTDSWRRKDGGVGILNTAVHVWGWKKQYASEQASVGKWLDLAWQDTHTASQAGHIHTARPNDTLARSGFDTAVNPARICRNTDQGQPCRYSNADREQPYSCINTDQPQPNKEIRPPPNCIRTPQIRFSYPNRPVSLWNIIQIYAGAISLHTHIRNIHTKILTFSDSKWVVNFHTSKSHEKKFKLYERVTFLWRYALHLIKEHSVI